MFKFIKVNLYLSPSIKNLKDYSLNFKHYKLKTQRFIFEFLTLLLKDEVT